MKRIFLVVVAVLASTLAISAERGQGEKQEAMAEPFWKIRARVHHTRPHREEGPLRQENISDSEVRELESQARGIVPGAVVNIGSVIRGCPCEDGPQCTNRVWVVAYTPDQSRGLMFSQINERWRLGPLQAWWLEYDSLHSSKPPPPDEDGRMAEKQRGALQELYESFPMCT